MKKFLASIILSALLPLQANAVLISTSVGAYDVTTVTGSFDDLSVGLTAQVFWGDASLADEFAGLVGGSLGSNILGLGPLFAVCSTDCLSDTSGALPVQGYAYDTLSSMTVIVTRHPGFSANYAIARSISVPEPTTFSLLIAGLFGLGALAHRHRRPIIT